jgi:hypothetical protein
VLHHFVQVGHHLACPAVVGNVLQFDEEGFIQLEELDAVSNGLF